MSRITIQDLSQLTPLDIQAMSDTRGGMKDKAAKRKAKYKHKRSLLPPSQHNSVFFGFGNTFIGNTAGVNNGSMTINGGIHL